MQAGELRERLTFQQRVELADGYGNTVDEEWADEFTVSANVRPRLAGEQVMQARLAGTNLMNITVRHSTHTVRVTPAWRCFDARSGRVYNIRSGTNPDQRKQWIELLCEGTDEYIDFTPTMFDFSQAQNSGYLALLEDI